METVSKSFKTVAVPAKAKKMNSRLLDYFFQMDGENVILYYKGPFDDTILAKISNYLREKFKTSPKAGQKLFSVFIEIAQNIAYYSSEVNHFDVHDSERGVGTIMIQEEDDKIIFNSGNLVKTEIVTGLIDKCNEINSLNHDELRALKREVRSNPRKEGHKGGNIGLIQVALKSKNPLVVQSEIVDDEQSFFMLSTVIER